MNEQGAVTQEQRTTAKPKDVSFGDYLSARDTAAIIGISEAALSRWRTQGIGPAWVPVSKVLVRYRRAIVEAWMLAREQGGEMAIEKRGGAWWYRYTHRGTEYRKNTGLAAIASNRKEAEAVEARAKLQAIAGQTAAKAVASSFADAAKEFIDWCYSTEYRSKPNSARRIETSFRSLTVMFGARKVSDVDANTIEDYKTWRLEKHGVRDVTLRHDLHALSVFFRKFAIRKKLALSNPVDLVSKPSDKDAVRIHVVTPDEESSYFTTARGTLYDVSRLILLQGCRPEEILSLTPPDVDLSTATLHIRGGKTRAAKRSLPLTTESVAILQRRLCALPAGSRWLFPSSRIEGWHVVKLNAQHDRACLDAKVSFVLYDLRHTFATRMLTEEGVDVATVAALMGHSSPKIVLDHYAHPTEGAKREAMRKHGEATRPKLRRVK